MIPREILGATRIGETANADFYLVRERVIAVVPRPGCLDDAETARASIELQQRHWRSVGHAGGAIVLMDAIVEQDKGARAVYAQLPDPQWITSYALVGGTLFGRAVASVFISLRKPPVPTRFFAEAAEAIAWVESHHERSES